MLETLFSIFTVMISSNIRINIKQTIMDNVYCYIYNDSVTILQNVPYSHENTIQSYGTTQQNTINYVQQTLYN